MASFSNILCLQIITVILFVSTCKNAEAKSALLNRENEVKSLILAQTDVSDVGFLNIFSGIQHHNNKEKQQKALTNLKNTDISSVVQAISTSINQFISTLIQSLQSLITPNTPRLISAILETITGILETIRNVVNNVASSFISNKRSRREVAPSGKEEAPTFNLGKFILEIISREIRKVIADLIKNAQIVVNNNLNGAVNLLMQFYTPTEPTDGLEAISKYAVNIIVRNLVQVIGIVQVGMDDIVKAITSQQ